MTKKIYLSMVMALGSITLLNAQNVNIPDANFKAYLVGHPSINTNNDTEIQVSEAAAYTYPIACNSMNIADLTGIEAFTAIKSLSCSGNQLTTLNVSANTALIDLDCNGNQLTTLNVSANTALTTLRCYNNHLSTLVISANTALTYLDCSINQLTTLDVSANTALTSLGCYENQLTTLDVSANTALITLSCSNNQLTTLDVSANTALTTFYCRYNQLATLDVSANTALTKLQCNNNQLATLNMKNGNNSNISSSVFNATNNPNLTCIQVDDATYSTNNWTNIDTTTSFSENCSTTGINENSPSWATFIYPNPTKDQIYFSVQSNVHLTNITGQIIMDRKNVNSLNLSAQSTGIYFLIFTDNNGQVTQRSKIVKE